MNRITPSDNLGERERVVWDRLIAVLGDRAAPIYRPMLELVAATVVDLHRRARALEEDGPLIRQPDGRVELHPLFEAAGSSYEHLSELLSRFADEDGIGPALPTGRNGKG